MSTERIKYSVINKNGVDLAELPELVNYHHKKVLWSMRIGTGVIGMLDCGSGRNGPRGKTEVVFGLGEVGLSKLIYLGGIPCIRCHPENEPGFWQQARKAVETKYNFEDLMFFANKKLLPFDTRRLDYAWLVETLGGLPNRLYLPFGLQKNEVIAFAESLEKFGIGVPELGYYDWNPKSVTRFGLYLAASKAKL